MGLYSMANNILFYGMVGHIYMTNYYPSQYNIFIVEAAHFCVLTYSRIQIFVDKMYRNLKKNPDFKSYADYFEGFFSHFFYPEVGNIEVIKDGQVFKHTSVESLLKDFPPTEFMDFIIYTDKQVFGQTNKIVCFDPPYNFSYEKCKYKFVSTTVVFSKKEHYNLKLFTEKENYFIVNNRLNKFLFCYLIRKQFGVIKDDASVAYTLELFDQNVDNVILSQDDEIVLEIDNYEVRKLCNEDNDTISYTETHAADAKEDAPPSTDDYISTDDE